MMCTRWLGRLEAVSVQALYYLSSYLFFRIHLDNLFDFCIHIDRYMAPEVFKHRKYDKKVDVFSFAMILYEVTLPPKTCKQAPSSKLYRMITSVLDDKMFLWL